MNPRVPWDAMFTKLKEYKAKFGTTRVGKHYVRALSQHANLEKYYGDTNNHSREKNYKTDDDNSNDIISVNEDEDEDEGKQTVEEGAGYRSLSATKNEDKSNLKTWVFRQRYLFSKGQLSKERQNKLNSIGFIWRAKKTKIQHRNNSKKPQKEQQGRNHKKQTRHLKRKLVEEEIGNSQKIDLRDCLLKQMVTIAPLLSVLALVSDQHDNEGDNKCDTNTNGSRKRRRKNGNGLIIRQCQDNVILPKESCSTLVKYDNRASIY
jgi:hypothetical protein